MDTSLFTLREEPVEPVGDAPFSQEEMEKFERNHDGQIAGQELTKVERHRRQQQRELQIKEVEEQQEKRRTAQTQKEEATPAGAQDLVRGDSLAEVDPDNADLGGQSMLLNMGADEDSLLDLAAELMQDMDTNNDGVIDLDEFLAAGHSREEFEKCDLNGDGVLDSHEMALRAKRNAAVMQRNSPRARRGSDQTVHVSSDAHSARGGVPVSAEPGLLRGYSSRSLVVEEEAAPVAGATAEEALLGAAVYAQSKYSDDQQSAARKIQVNI